MLDGRTLLHNDPCASCDGSVALVTGECLDCGQPHLRPQPGPQTDFLRCSADIVLFGGGMGGGKTYSLLLDWLYQAQRPGANGLIVRNRSVDITIGGGLWDEAARVYASTGMYPRGGSVRDMTWPSGAKLSFKHLDDRNKERFKGPGFSWIGIEEANECAIDAIMWLFLARGRSTSGIRPVLRMTCNPDVDHALASWVQPYLHHETNEETGAVDGEPDRSKSGMVLYMMRKANSHEFVFAPTRQEVAAKAGGDPEDALSFAFIPSLLEDNKVLTETDPAYKRKFSNMGAVGKARDLRGNWKVRQEIGGMLREELWGGLVRAPLGPIVKRVRGWDKAATEPRPDDGNNPDFTAGVRLEWDVAGRVYVSDVVACRHEPPGVDRLMANTASKDGPAVTQAIERDPAQAGKVDARHTIGVLRGTGRCGRVDVAQAIKDKVTKAQPMARDLEQGLAPGSDRGEPGFRPKFFILDETGWTERIYQDALVGPVTMLQLFWSMVEPFYRPGGSTKKDIVDAMTTAYQAGTKPVAPPRPDAAKRFAAYT